MELLIISIIFVLAFSFCIIWYSNFKEERQEEKKREEEQRRERERQEEIQQWERERQEEQQRIKNQFEHRSYEYFNKYKGSEFVKMVVNDMKKHMPNPPYDWRCSVHSYSISYSYKSYNFYEMGYENLSSNEQIYGLAKSIAYNLGSGFEVECRYDREYGYSFVVDYIIKKPLKKI